MTSGGEIAAEDGRSLLVQPLRERRPSDHQRKGWAVEDF